MNMTPVQQFFVKNCFLAPITTGDRASSLLELRDKLSIVDPTSIYFHFWNRHLKSQFVHTQPHNDFANWVFHRLNDNILAERLNIIDPSQFNTLEDLRQELIEQIERRLDDYEIVLWTKREDQFHFIRSTIVVFETSLTIENPETLTQEIKKMSLSSIFYHFIDARARTLERVDDFTVWLNSFDGKYKDLVNHIQSIDPYFLSLSDLKDELINMIQHYFRVSHV